MMLRLVALLAAALPGPVLAQPALDPAQEEAAFAAAGFTRQDGAWRKCDDPGTPSYTPGQLELVGDLDGDGRPEAIVTEGGTYCFGNTGTGFALLSRQADGGWRLMFEQTGVPRALETRGADGWPDIEVGGPGFCFGIWRWNGAEYAFDRSEYEGRPCRPGG